MAYIIQLRRDTAANFTAANPVLAEGEPAFEIDTTKEKLGNGVDAWVNLPYRSGTSSSSLLSEPFIYTGGLQEFVLPNPIAQIYSVLVGNISLQRTQYEDTGSKVTITDTLTVGAVIEINYKSNSTPPQSSPSNASVTNITTTGFDYSIT